MNKVIANNKKAYHDYFVEEKLECGIELKGTEVKSVKKGNVSIKEAWASVDSGEIVVHNMHISPYEQGSFSNTEPLRPKKLLAHKREIRKIASALKLDGLTLIPLSIYQTGNLVKVELGLCKGKKNYDKRQSLKEKDAKREMERNR